MTHVPSDTSSGLPDPETHAEVYAGVTFKRFLAWIIDAVFVGLFSVLVAILTLGIGFFVFAGLLVVVSFVYRVLTIANGAGTWGMRIMALEFRRHDGSLFGFSDAVLHTLGYLFSLAVAPLQLISVLSMMLTSRGQGLTDHVMGSALVNRLARD